MKNDAPARHGGKVSALELRQTIEITAEQVQRMIADHYAARNLRFHPSHVRLNVHGSSGGGYSSRSAGFDGATIRFPDDLASAAEAEGMPSVLELKPAAVATIVARRVDAAFDAAIGPDHIHWDVTDDGGSGFSRSGPALRHARIVLKTSC